MAVDAIEIKSFPATLKQGDSGDVKVAWSATTPSYIFVGLYNTALNDWVPGSKSSQLKPFEENFGYEVTLKITIPIDLLIGTYGLWALSVSESGTTLCQTSKDISIIAKSTGGGNIPTPGKTWIPGIPNTYVIIGGAAILLIGTLALTSGRKSSNSGITLLDTRKNPRRRK